MLEQGDFNDAGLRWRDTHHPAINETNGDDDGQFLFERIMSAIAAGAPSKDDYGVPILDLDDVMEAQIEVGLGPLHTQFGDQGYAYTSLFLEPAVARWAMGGSYADKNSDPE